MSFTNEQFKNFLPANTEFGRYLLRKNPSSSGSNFGARPEEFTGDTENFHEFLDWLTGLGIEFDSLVRMDVILPDGNAVWVYCTQDIFAARSANQRLNPAVLDSLTRKQFTNSVFQSLRAQLLALRRV